MLIGVGATALQMKRTVILFLALTSMLWSSVVFGQGVSEAGTSPVNASPAYGAGNIAGVPSASAQGGPVSYASVTQVNGLLAQLEAASKNTQADLQRLRIERWKTDGSYKKQSLANVDSIQRNLQGALPEMIAQLRSSPEDLPATFKVYRNLDALYDVLGSVVESTGAFGSKDDFQSLSNDLSSFEGTRKQFGERIENLASSKEAEINRLRNDLKAAEAKLPATPPKKTVVDDNEPAKKPAPKKKAASKTAPAPSAKPPAGQAAATPQ